MIKALNLLILEFSDTEVIGLKLLSGKNSKSKRFLFRYRYPGINGSRKGCIAIGHFPDIDLSTARRVARQYKVLLAEGIDPKAKRDAISAFPTVYDFFWDTYLPLAKKHKRTWKDDVSRFQTHCKPLFAIPYNEVTAHQVMQLHLNMSESSNKYRPYAPSTCNRVFALLKTMGKLANQLLDITNVAGKVSLLPEDNARTRYCSIEEIKRLIDASLAYGDIYAGSLIALLFLLGCRESELRLRKWSDVDIGNKTIRVPRTKNGSYHILYLSDLVLTIINKLPKVKGNPYLFVGRFKRGCINRPATQFKVIKIIARIDKPEEVVLNTARHGVASHAISNGVDISAVQKLLNHKLLATFTCSLLRNALLTQIKKAVYSTCKIDNMHKIKKEQLMPVCVLASYIIFVCIHHSITIIN